MSRPLPEDDDAGESIDFKPFFDMIVGVLFVLLVIISGQIYQTRFRSNDAESPHQLRAEKARLEQEVEALRKRLASVEQALDARRTHEQREKIQAFLQRVKRALDARGLEPEDDVSGMRLSIRLDRLLAADGNRLALRSERISGLADALAASVPCLGESKMPGCGPFTLDGSLFLDVETGKDAPAGRSPHTLLQVLAGRLAEEEPRLMSTTGKGGHVVVPRNSRASAEAEGGWLHLIFTFDAPSR